MNILKYFRSAKIAVALCLLMLFQIVVPSAVYALTSGPTQPEVQSFEPVGTTDMVDIFTGDFNYNIPLFELPGPNGGYPFNIAYHSGVSMDDEASWTGLGWNINAGVINRQVRGLADDFSGDKVLKRQDLKTNWTVGVKSAFSFGVFGGEGDKGENGGLSLSLGAFYNNYRGYGQSLGFGLNYHGSAGGLGLDLDVNSQSGATLSPSLTLSSEYGSRSANFNLGFDYNSRGGIESLDFSLTGEKNNIYHEVKGEPIYDGNRGAQGQMVGGHLSFVNNGYSPTIQQEMHGSNLTGSFKFTPGWNGVYSTVTLMGYYSEQHLKHKNETIDLAAFGYNHMHEADANASKQLTDFNRSQDGIVRDETPNLAMPNLTYDVYTAVGQGIGGSFRSHRSDIGAIYDQNVINKFGGGSLGGDVGNSRFGLNGSITYSTSETLPWESGTGYFGFTDAGGYKEYEPTYYKILGEYTSENTSEYNYIAGDKVVSPELNADGEVSGDLKGKGSATYTPATYTRQTRRPRHMGILSFTNDELLGSNDNIVQNEFKVDYFTSPNNFTNKQSLNRDSRLFNGESSDIAHHTGGFTSVNAEGIRYIYALPVYNTMQLEAVYSSEGDYLEGTSSSRNDGYVTASENEHQGHSNHFLDETTTPPFVHSYMLTAILGADYVDVDNNGPSENDLGYWVKFNYVKTYSDASPYRWRSPYNGGNFMRGAVGDNDDDKGSFMYGEKEIFYLASAETKSHIAYFHLSDPTARPDARGVQSKYGTSNPHNQADNRGSQYQYYLDFIELISKDADPGDPALVKVKFHYNENGDLCPDVPNNGTSGGGKLTLSKITFEREGNTKTSTLNPYKFEYSSFNPSYNTHAQDRWGQYKETPTSLLSGGNPTADYLDHIENRYTPQFDNDDPAQFQLDQDEIASAWQLTKIITPSKSEISVQYERDDYAYVQDKVATQMFKIAGFQPFGEGLASSILANQTLVYDSDYNPDNNADRRIYFELEKVYDPTTSTYVYEDDIDKYVDGIDQIYFKVKTHLKGDGGPEIDYVSGYLNLMDGERGTVTYSNGGTVIKYGYITVDKVSLGNKSTRYHPIALASWQHLQTVMSQWANVGTMNSAPGSDDANKEGRMRSLLGMLGNIKDLFTSFEGSANRRSWANHLDDNNYSFIRLTAPDKIKIGGGLRVKQLTINDKWSGSEGESTYGQVYDYTTEEDGDIISSGVAQYEPMVGGDENPMRTAKVFPATISTKSNLNLLFEYPINESYYPAPVVGYSKVTIRSLATETEMTSSTGAGTTGQTVHEFYTAKDFPVITEETVIDKRPYRLFIPIIFLGQILIEKMTASQGYKIELNDMHGKPKKISNYGQSMDGEMASDPYSWVSYDYFEKPEHVKGKPIRKLNNSLKVLVADGPGGLKGDQGEVELGVDYDFFTDMRRSKSYSMMGGLNWNNEFLMIGPIYIPLPIPWPNIDYSKTDIKLAVSNKIIHRSGILQSVTAFDGQSTVTTTNEYFDALTGRPLVTSVNNSFEDKIYDYKLPAFWKYEGMGPAYKNLGLTIGGITISCNSTYNELCELRSSDINEQNLSGGDAFFFPGDEIILTSTTGVNYPATVVLVQPDVSDSYIAVNFMQGTPSGGGLTLKVVRSGRRNHLTADAANYITLNNDPVLNRDNGSCNYNIPKPVEVTENVVTYEWQEVPCGQVNSYKNALTPTFKKTINLLNMLAEASSSSVYNSSIYSESAITDLKNLNNAIEDSLVDMQSLLNNTPCKLYRHYAFYQDISLYSQQVRPYFHTWYPSFFENGSYNKIFDKCIETSIWNEVLNQIDPNIHLPISSADWCNTFGPDNNIISSHPFMYGTVGLEPSYITFSNPRPLFSYSQHLAAHNPELLELAAVDVAFNNPDLTDYTLIVRGAMCKPATQIVPTAGPCYDWVKVVTEEEVIAASDEDLSMNLSLLDNVLKANAVCYSDNWQQDFLNTDFNLDAANPDFDTHDEQYDYLTGNPNTLSFNQFQNGERGIWRPWKTYTYVEERSQTPSIVNLKTDGTFDDVPVFDQSQPLFTSCDETDKWTLTNTVTRYSPYNYEIENQNILGFYSSALYGYDGQLPIAVANNASVSEVGFESFEECGTGSSITQENNSNGNLVIRPIQVAQSGTYYQEFDIVGKGYMALTSVPYSVAKDASYVKILAQAIPGSGLGNNMAESILIKAKVTQVVNLNGNAAFRFEELLPGFPENPDNKNWVGKVYLPNTLGALGFNSSGQAEIVNNKAHTGKQSIKVNGSVFCLSRNIRLEPSKKYWISGWISSDFHEFFSPTSLTNYATPETGITVTLWESINGVFVSFNQQPTVRGTGEVVEGWRRIETVIETPPSDGYFELGIQLGSAGAIPLYFDDIRVQPYNSTMQTYVYNTDDHKLTAVLDENNYSTQYSYDSEGNLFLVKKETEKGLLTVQESDSHIK